MSRMHYTRQELLAVPKRKWDEKLDGVCIVYVIPSQRKHDSGYACMDFVAVRRDGSMARFGGMCDDVSFAGSYFRMDCQHSPQIIRIWNSRYTFSVTNDISSISFVEATHENQT